MSLLERSSRPTLQYAILGVLFAWALLAQLTISSFVIYSEATSSQHVESPFTTRSETVQIHSLKTAFQHSGLQVGDDILALNGQPIAGAEQLDNILFHLRPGDTLTVTLRRSVAGHAETKTVTVTPHPDHPDTVSWAFLLGSLVLLPLSCLLLGFYIAFARPSDPLAWITLGMLAAFGQLIDSGISSAIWSPWRQLEIAYHALLTLSWPVLMVLFALYFPVAFPFLRRHRWINWLIAAPWLVFTGLELYGEFMEGSHLDALARLAAFEQASSGPIYVMFTVYVTAFFALLGFKRSILEASDARRRLNVMMAGCSLAMVPVVPVVLAQLRFIPALPVWLETVCLLMVLFFPITMAYVIVVQRAMDVRMVVRSGVRYALASTGVRILRTGLIAATVIFTIRFASGREIWEAVVIACVGVVFTIAFRRISARILNWTDRRFFREAYNSEAILTGLSNSVADIRDTKTLLETVTQRISDSLHIDRIAVLLEQGGRFQPAYALGFNGAHPTVSMERNSAALRLLNREKSP